MGEASDYVPVPALRTRTLPSAPDDVDWRLPVESWDREYRRFRFNTTRVQRKYLYLIISSSLLNLASYEELLNYMERGNNTFM